MYFENPNLLFKVVQEYERAVIFRLGRLLSGGARGPGVFFIIPCVDIYEKIDMRTATYEIPPQEILTKDSVTVFVNAIMYYKVRDATSAIANVDDYSGSARLLAATTLRNVLGTKNLGDILSERESIANEMQDLLLEATEPWGVTVERVEVMIMTMMDDDHDDDAENGDADDCVALCAVPFAAAARESNHPT